MSSVSPRNPHSRTGVRGWLGLQSDCAAVRTAKGLSPELALTVATPLTEHDALGAHAGAELGIDHETLTNPWQAAAGLDLRLHRRIGPAADHHPGANRGTARSSRR